MRAFASPDEVIYRYLELWHEIGQPKGLNPVIGTGLVFGSRCSTCNSTRRNEKLDGNYVCGACGEYWPATLEFMLTNQVQRSRRSTPMEGKLADLGTMAKILECLTKEQLRLYCQLYLIERVGNRHEIARVANKRWPRGRRWTQWHVRELVKNARHRLSEELHSRGLYKGAT